MPIEWADYRLIILIRRGQLEKKLLIYQSMYGHQYPVSLKILRLDLSLIISRKCMKSVLRTFLWSIETNENSNCNFGIFKNDNTILIGCYGHRDIFLMAHFSYITPKLICMRKVQLSKKAYPLALSEHSILGSTVA